MSTLVSAGRRVLPRGWADFGLQLAIWFGFLGLYQLARGIADRNPPKAFDNGLHVIGIERHVHGLIGYVLLPTAPPRMFPDFGFDDTLSNFGELNHGSGLVEFAANPYAAMPSLHAADALIVGIVLASVCRNRVAKVLWLLWPAWVWFSVMATGNHFWLDIVAGILVAVIAGLIVYRNPLRRRRTATA